MISSKKTHQLQKCLAPKLEILIGYEVKAQRQHRGMTIADLAKRAGLSPSMISKIENGSTSASLTTLQMLSKTFSIPISSFFRSFEELRNVRKYGSQNVSS